MTLRLFDGVCMKLIFIGESVKKIDKITNQAFMIKCPASHLKR